MKNVTKKVVLEVNLTGDQWELFTNSMDCTEATTALNSTFNLLSAAGATKDVFRKEMESVMSKYSEFGASDSEPRWKLEDLLEMQFA